MLRSRLTSPCALFLLGFGIHTGSVAAAAEPGGLQPGLEQLLDSLETIRQREDIPSVALTLVNNDGLIWTGALGVQDVTTRLPASPDTLYRIGSITKSFTALALLLTQEQGLLSMNSPLNKLAPTAPLSNPWSEQRPVTIAHLLEHSAGLTGLTQTEFDHSNPKPLSLREALAVAPDARRSYWPPGLHYSYTNAGAGLAAYALQQVSDRRYEEFVEHEIFAPLGMDSAGFFLDADTRDRLATGYDSDGQTPIPYWHMIFRPFGGINATPREMGHFVRLLLNRGRLPDGEQLASVASITRMERPCTTLAARAGVTYGYGLGNYSWAHNGFVFHGHGGDGDGYLSRYGYNRDLGRGYFLTINAFNNGGFEALRERVEDYLTADQAPPPPPPPASLDQDRLRSLTGRYQQVTWRFPWQRPDTASQAELSVIHKKGRLFTRRDGKPPRQLIAVDKQRFRRQGEPLATLAFSRFHGRLYLQGELGNYRRIEDTDIRTSKKP